MRPRRAVRAVPLRMASLLGVVSLACLVVLLVTGLLLMRWYDPSSEQVRYDGSYPLLQGVPVSRAYASVVHISLEVRGGLLVRQAHHWAALMLPASLMLQMLCTFFTGGFRRPRQWGWVLLSTTFLLALAGGWSGYGLPDDLLAGTGLRIFEGILVGLPLIGSRATFLVFGGEFPGQVIERMYWLHVAVVPVLLVAVLAARLVLAARQRPAQPMRPGSTEHLLVGLPLRAWAARALGLFLVTCGVIGALAGAVTIAPVWRGGPSSTGHAGAGSQPDWYTAFLDGGLRLVPPGWETTLFDRTIPWGLLVPQGALAAFLGVVVLWPFLESRWTRDRADHHVLERPRDRPTRTAFGVAGLVFFCALWLAGATDIVTTQLSVSFELQVLVLRTVVLLGPLVAFPLTRGICEGLLAAEQERMVHGTETGRIDRSRDGGYAEVHRPPVLPVPPTQLALHHQRGSTDEGSSDRRPRDDRLPGRRRAG